MNGIELVGQNPLMEAAEAPSKKGLSVAGKLEVESEARRENVPGVEGSETLDRPPGSLAARIDGGKILAPGLAPVEADTEIHAKAVSKTKRILGECAQVLGLTSVD
jgi:hypothetical protein